MRLVVLPSVNRNTMRCMNWDFFDTGNTETLKLLRIISRCACWCRHQLIVTLGHSFTVYALWQ